MSGRGDGGADGGTDEDEAWRSIVEHYGERATLDDAPVDDGPDAGVRRPAEAAEPVRRHASDPLDPWVEQHLAEEHYEPPEPAAVPLPEPRRLLAWVGVFGVPLLLVLLVALSVPVPPWAGLLMLVWFVGGFGYLVATMRRDEDDDPDDGAVV